MDIISGKTSMIFFLSLVNTVKYLEKNILALRKLRTAIFTQGLAFIKVDVSIQATQTSRQV